MTLPSIVLPPENRTFGMGVFFSVYHAVMMIAPRIARGLADGIGNAAMAFHAGGGSLRWWKMGFGEVWA